MDQDSFDDMKAKMLYNFKIAFDVLDVVDGLPCRWCSARYFFQYLWKHGCFGHPNLCPQVNSKSQCEDFEVICSLC